MAEVINPWENAPNTIDTLFRDPSFMKKHIALQKETLGILKKDVRSRSAIYLVSARESYNILTRGIPAPKDFEQAAKASFLTDLENWTAVLPQQPVDVLKPGIRKWEKSWEKPPHPDFPNILPWQDNYLAIEAVRLCQRALNDTLQYIDPAYYRERDEVIKDLLIQTHFALRQPLSDLITRMHVAMLFVTQLDSISRASLDKGYQELTAIVQTAKPNLAKGIRNRLRQALHFT